VGADAAAVALSEAPGAQTELTLVVDVGTNAEILLGDTEGVLACSSPTGPAFEGAQISSGQRAAPGAIERVEIDPDTKEPRFKVIGSDLWSTDPGFAEATKDTGVTGICGSGIIEAVAEMRMAGLLDASGLIGSAEATGTPRCEPTGRTHAYLLHDGTAEGGPRILVTQGDIRAIQLAKSALYAGARLLMDKRGADRVDRVVLAGAFGAHISPKHAMVLGMIPDARSTRSPAPATPPVTGRAWRCATGPRGRRSRRPCAGSRRSRPRSSPASRSISSTPTRSRTRSIPSRSLPRSPPYPPSPSAPRARNRAMAADGAGGGALDPQSSGTMRLPSASLVMD
jgi:hypothetical protein